MTLRPAAALAMIGMLLTAPALADNAANKARATLKECLDKIPLDRLSDERAIGDCLGKAQGAASAEDRRRGQIEFNRRLDDMDRMIERTRRDPRIGLPR